jgi:asparagine N-glycosylation enzyme membrane subunit Stt3
VGRFRLNAGLLTVILVTLIFGVSLVFRIVFPYDKIFVNGDVKFASNDVYFYMRLVDNLVHNFPHLTTFDPFLIFPGGGPVGHLPFFHWMMAIIAWIFGVGSPTQRVVDLVGAYLPAIMGALTVIPAFFLGKVLFNRWAGVLAAGLAAIIPGEFMTRTSLAAGDTPVAEVFFTTTAMLFLVLALKSSQQKNLSINHLVHWDWEVIRLPLLWTLLAGIFLGMYLTTWLGALLFIFIILAYFLFQFVNNHLREKPTDHLAIIGFVSILVALIIFLPHSLSSDLSLAMILAVIVPPVLWGLSRLFSGLKLKTYFYPLALVGLGAVLLLVLHAAVPGIYETLWTKFRFVFFPTGSTATTTQEMQPFLMPSGTFTTLNAWGNFATSFFLIRGWPIPGIGLVSFAMLMFLFVRGNRGNQSWYISILWVVVILAMLEMLLIVLTYQSYRLYAIIPLVVFAYLFLRQKVEKEHWLLFFIWSLVIFIATMVQRRFAYYLAVNISLLSAYLSWQIIALAGAGRSEAAPEVNLGKDQRVPETTRKADHYETLGVSRSASYKEIKSAFRRLSAEHQRIKNPSPEQQKKLKEINNAHEVLSNPERRRDYDVSYKVISAREKRKKKRRERRVVAPYPVYTAALVVVVFFAVFFFNLTHAWSTAGDVPFAPSDAWQEALTWMKDNTPDPMGNDDAYYQLYNTPPGEPFQYPDTAYGVASWWDYGYWITGIAHRIPNANPSQDPGAITRIANLFLSANESTAHEYMQELGSSYVVIDTDTNISKFWAIADWAGLPQEKYINYYYISYGGRFAQIPLFEVDYYNTLSVRLYNFDGKAVSSSNTTVITYQDVTDNQGNSYRVITDIKSYTSYQEANIAISSGNNTLNQRIVGSSPFISPIDFTELSDYKLVYSSTDVNSLSFFNLPEFPKLDQIKVPQVKIFKYTPQ